MSFDVAIWGTVAQWAAAAATSAAVLVALFKDAVLRRWYRPKLHVSIKNRPPDCHKTTIHFTYEAKSVSAGRYYFRLWVSNEGSELAENVQVFAAKLEKQGPGGIFNEIANFLPMNLRWSETGGRDNPEVFADGISPKMGKIL